MNNLLLGRSRGKGTNLVDKGIVISRSATLDIEIDTVIPPSTTSNKINRQRETHPSREALPNGLVDEDPPRNISQIVCAKLVACASDWKPTDPVAPPRLRVMILPFA